MSDSKNSENSENSENPGKPEILKNLKEYKKEYRKGEEINPYIYEYYSIKNGSIVPDDTLNQKYGESRENFEKFKYHDDSNVGYSGLISLREITQDKKLIGYVKETKKPLEKNKITDEVIKKAKKEFYDYFGTSEHNTAFRYYVESNCTDALFGSSKLHYINTYIDIIEDYNYNEDYKEFIKKLIRP